MRVAGAFDRPAGSQVARVARSPILLDTPQNPMGERLFGCILGGSVVAVVLGGPRGADGAEPCVSLEAEGGMSKAWADAVDELRRQLAEIAPTECKPVTLLLASKGDVVRLVALRQDGQRAERDLTQPSSLAPTALGLVLSLPSESSNAPRPSIAANASPSAMAPPPPAAPRPSQEAVPVEPAVPPRPLHAWVGLAAGARISAPAAIAMVDLEGRADLFLDRWLFLASFRYVPFGLASTQGVDADVYREIAVALGFGRRFNLGSGGAVDVALSPSLIAMRLETDLLPGNESADQFANDVELRLGLSARLALPLGRRWALTLTADSDIAPASVFNPRRVGTLLPFPTWTSGVRLGASGALL